ncbi:TPA: gp58-like family protein [Streptococcus suis]|uniref:gp58-like family protein n=7 Tax=Streptococcus suis TaxID=1307 RepID=UPI00005E2A2D|nr:gp58-like family protein [Streptococcus suis]MCH1721065.1 gp58-like family protein [Streptococcus suis]MCL4912579.1 gp58-like family protein [Streptococcus suis]UYF63900.1 gp58-like family protein [Streptococcus suis 89-1591]
MVHTVTFNQAMLAKDRVFAIRAGAYTSSDIKEASFNYGYISGDTLKPGGTVAGSAKLTFTSIITSFNKLDKVYPEIGLKVGDSFEWVAMGEYFVNDINIDRNRNTTELDLMDGMFKLNQPYISDLTYPAQIRDVIREICVKTGVELETDDLGFRAIQHHIQSKADKKDITFREVLSQAIQLLGFSAFFNRKGKLEIRGLTESNITITADNYFLHGLTKSELMYQIAGITCKKDKETLTVGLRTGRSLELENSFMIQNILDDLYYDLKEIKYYPFSLDWQGHLKLDVGQWITLKTNKNETFKVPVLSQSFNFKGGLKSKISADSKAGNDTQYSYKGFLGKRIEQMSTEIEAEVQQQLEYKDKEFDEKINKAKSEINDGIEQAQAEAERYADAIKQEIDTEIAQVNQSMQSQEQEHDREVANILSKTQSVESLANQAKADAANAIARANQVKTEAIADARAQVATVNQALNTAKTELQSAIASADQKARDSQASATALRNDLNLQASKILAQAQAQTALTNRVSTVESLADGTRSIVAELSKTVNKATGDIASVTSRTKTVEDTLSQTRTQYEALTQTVNAQSGQIDSINRKTADLQSGIDGVTERFESLRIEDNLLLNSSFNQNLTQWQGTGVTIVGGKARITGEFNKTKYIYQSIKSQTANDDVSQVYIASISVKVSNYAAGSINPYLALYISGIKNDSAKTWFGATYLTPSRLEAVNNKGIVQFTTTFKVNVPRSQIDRIEFHIYARDFTGEVEFEKVSLRRGNIDLGWQASPEDLRSEIATYKRSAEESSAELSRQIQLADGKAVEAKTYAQQTAEGFKTRLESLETYKDGESTRASQYFTASRAETAKQLSAERAAIATNYVAKSTYDENVRGTTLKLNEIKTTADTAKQNLATYQNTVDRKLTELTSTTQTLDGKINTASAKITQNANEISKRLTSTQVDKAITDKGYQTKSDVDNNITGRGYITNSALQPYALSTTVQNLVKETSDSFSRTISETRALIPTSAGGRNYLLNSKTEISGGWASKTISLSQELLSNLSKIRTVTISCDVEGRNVTIRDTRKRFGLACPVEIDGKINYWEVWQAEDTIKKRISQTFTVPEGKTITKFYSPSLWIQADGNIKVSNPKLEFGVLPTDWSPAPEDYVTVTAFNTVTDTVNSHTRTLSEQGSSISQAVQTAQGLIARVENLSVGGRNYFLKSDFSISSGNKAIAIHPDFMKHAKGKKFVVSVEVEGKNVVFADRGRFGISTSGQRPGLTWRDWLEVWETGTGNIPKKRIYQVFSYIDDWMDFGANLYVQTGGEAIVGYPKLEIGTMPTDWSPAPEDGDQAIQAVSTQVSTLAGSYAIKNLTSTGNVLNQLNLNKDGSVKIDGSLVQITGKTYIQDGVITSAKIGSLDAGKITSGYLSAARIATNSIDGSKMVFDQAFVNKMTANEALFKQLFAKNAFITSVQAVAVSAKQIAGGIAKALNGGMDVNFDESKINFYTNVAAIRRIYTGHPTQFIKFETEGNYSRTIIGSNRNGGEVFNSATFAGIVVENTNNINTEDNVRIYGDNTLLRHAQGDVGWNINSVTQRIVPANINAESEIWSKHFVAPDKNSKPIRLDTAVAALWDIWNHIIYNNFEFNEALRTHIKARRDNWKFELNL